jgi:hypothetical protein
MTMFATKTLGSAASRLTALLQDATADVDETAAEARSVGLDRAGEVVAHLIRAARTRRKVDTAAIRAAQLARELRLAAAAPALVRCLERFQPTHPLCHVAQTVLPHLGPAAVDALLPALERCEASDGRARLAEILSATPVDDDRIRAALVRMLDDDPSTAARLLADRCEWRALPDLVRAAERIQAEPIDCCDICAGEALGAIALAVGVLGGALSPELADQIDQVLERATASWVPATSMFTLPEKLRAAVGTRPGRNDPCPCGSGKKFKRCCLDDNARATTGGASHKSPPRRLH